MSHIRKNKSKRNITAKQIANLRPIQKGEVRNPNGGKAHNPVMRAFQNKGREDYRDVLKIVLYGTRAELKEFIANPETSNLQVLVALAFEKALEAREFGLVERLADQIFGKQAETLNVVKLEKLNDGLKEADRSETRKILAELDDDV